MSPIIFQHSSLDLSISEFFYDDSFKDYIRVGGYYYKDNSFDKINSLFEFISVLNSALSNTDSKYFASNNPESFIQYNSSELIALVPNLTDFYEFSQCKLHLLQSPILITSYLDLKTKQMYSRTIPLEIYEIAVKNMSNLFDNFFRFKGVFYLHSVQFCEELISGEIVLRMRIRGYEETNPLCIHNYETNLQ